MIKIHNCIMQLISLLWIYKPIIYKLAESASGANIKVAFR